MPQLNSADLETRLAGAEEAEQSQRRRFQALQAAAVAAGVEDSEDERSAARDLHKITHEVGRLRVALEHARTAERNHAETLRLADEDAQDRAAEAALDDLERCADKMEKALTSYATAWDKLVAARNIAQQRISRHRPGVFRPDLALVQPQKPVEDALAQASATVPGRRRSGVALGYGAPLSAAEGRGLSEQVASLTDAARQDLQRARSLRRPLPQPAIVAPEPAELWTV